MVWHIYHSHGCVCDISPPQRLAAHFYRQSGFTVLVLSKVRRAVPLPAFGEVEDVIRLDDIAGACNFRLTAAVPLYLYQLGHTHDGKRAAVRQRNDAAKIRAFFIHPAWARRGIGSKIQHPLPWTSRLEWLAIHGWNNPPLSSLHRLENDSCISPTGHNH